MHRSATIAYRVAPRRTFMIDPKFSLYRKFISCIKDCKISNKRTEKRSMIAINNESLKQRIEAKKHSRAVKDENKKIVERSYKFMVAMF